MEIYVTRHALEKFQERTGLAIKDTTIKKLFKQYGYTILEPAKGGRLIIQVKDYVFVVYRTNSKIVICTSYGFTSSYQLKRPNLQDIDEIIARMQWARSLKMRRRG